MRTAFFRALSTLAERDGRVQLIVGDLGFGVVEHFARCFPDRFLNAGVAEQNMTAIAAGMALSGKIVFTYSIANFPILRCLEQVRNDVCYHKANVKIVAVGGGLSYGSLGMTHHATEDLAILRVLPEMVVVAPGDPLEVEAATHAIAERNGPCYLRLGRAGEPDIHRDQFVFQLGQAIEVRSGGDLTLISTGAMLETAMEAAKMLSVRGLHARVLSMHTVKPLDSGAVLSAARDTHAVFTLEEHSITGGLGGAVAEVLAECGEPPVLFRRFGLPTSFSAAIGDQEYLRKAHGLSADSIAEGIESAIEQTQVHFRKAGR
jgi:transketolase